MRRRARSWLRLRLRLRLSPLRLRPRLRERERLRLESRAPLGPLCRLQSRLPSVGLGPPTPRPKTGRSALLGDAPSEARLWVRLMLRLRLLLLLLLRPRPRPRLRLLLRPRLRPWPRARLRLRLRLRLCALRGVFCANSSRFFWRRSMMYCFAAVTPSASPEMRTAVLSSCPPGKRSWTPSLDKCCMIASPPRPLNIAW